MNKEERKEKMSEFNTKMKELSAKIERCNRYSSYSWNGGKR